MGKRPGLDVCVTHYHIAPNHRQTGVSVRLTNAKQSLVVRGEVTVPEVFISAHGRAMTRVGFTQLLRKHVQRAARDCPSLQRKHVSPHVLRHTCAMMIYQATGDLRKVSLWLGHANMQATEVYVRADPTEKLDAIGAVIPPSLRRGQFTVPDRLIAMLHGQ